MDFYLTTKYPKQKERGKCFVNATQVSNDARKGLQSIAMWNNGVLAELWHTTLISMGSDVIKLGGFEPIGVNKDGTDKIIWQEWYLIKI